MPIALVSSAPQSPGPATNTFTNKKNIFNFKLKHRDALLWTVQKKCMLGVVEVSGRGWLVVRWVFGLFWLVGPSSVHLRSTEVLLGAVQRGGAVWGRRKRGVGHPTACTAGHTPLWNTKMHQVSANASHRMKAFEPCVFRDLHLCVDLLWDSVLLDPGMDLSKLLSLLLAEPRLQGLKTSKLLPILCQHLILVPDGHETQGKDKGLILCVQERQYKFLIILLFLLLG